MAYTITTTPADEEAHTGNTIIEEVESLDGLARMLEDAGCTEITIYPFERTGRPVLVATAMEEGYDKELGDVVLEEICVFAEVKRPNPDEVLEARLAGIRLDWYEACRQTGATHAEIMEAYQAEVSPGLNWYGECRKAGATHAEVMEVHEYRGHLDWYSDCRKAGTLHAEVKETLGLEPPTGRPDGTEGNDTL